MCDVASLVDSNYENVRLLPLRLGVVARAAQVLSSGRCMPDRAKSLRVCRRDGQNRQSSNASSPRIALLFLLLSALLSLPGRRALLSASFLATSGPAALAHPVKYVHTLRRQSYSLVPTS
jgi:hypothetical protein